MRELRHAAQNHMGAIKWGEGGRGVVLLKMGHVDRRLTWHATRTHVVIYVASILLTGTLLQDVA